MNGKLSLPVVFLPPKEFVLSREALSRPYSLREAQAYTRWLATRHYENFPVVSLLLPRRLHQDFYNVYAFCRWADDLGDEVGDRAESERLLEWWGVELEAMYGGHASHPVFLALQGTVESHKLPIVPFQDLIRAFVQDQRISRYSTYAELFEYCRCSANPVGRLVLYLCGYSDEARQRLSDSTCTALQLANFWQDVPVDLDKGRLYLPLDVLERLGCPVEDVLGRRATPAFRAAMWKWWEWRASYSWRDCPLARMVDRRLAVDVELFSRGGMSILEKIEKRHFDVFSRRPVVSRSERVWLLISTVARAAFSKAA